VSEPLDAESGGDRRVQAVPAQRLLFLAAPQGRVDGPVSGAIGANANRSPRV
jgi:hypothetical protein